MREITQCEVCGNNDLSLVLNLGSHPLPDDLRAIGDPTHPTEYPVQVLFCNVCKTAHQRYQVPKTLLFPPTYHYRARQTQDVIDGMHQFVDSCKRKMLIDGARVLDIGCNDGTLLNAFRAHGALTTGIEPTDAAYDAQRAGHGVAHEFFDLQSATDYTHAYPKPDLITFTNVFAHIENLDDLLTALIIVKKPSTWIVIENHYLGSVLDRNQFDTFYHEHPRTYSYTSFLKIAEHLGMHVASVEFPVRYGGNIRVFLKPGDGPSPQPVIEDDFGSRLVELNDKVKLWSANKLMEIEQATMGGPISAAAFPGRAAILIRLLGLDRIDLEAVYEKPGSKKIGYYATGTYIPIVSDEVFQCLGEMDRPVLNMAWHIPAEIEKRWRGFGYTGRFIQAVDPGDFS